eukprot:TRINITY_DN15773_c0_g1_i2.p1 TRINITY_DN15773_c0_g1~~TRINITY_DN15773_c0_g1_i2.p1  ORF type:complete len:104 (-),score=25.35 TRINITY_DN15773_c0_g1_i2:469-780(-)
MDIDPSLSAASPQDEWDAEGFEIPSLKLNVSGSTQKEAVVANSSSSSCSKVSTVTDNIYLGPYGTPPSLRKQQDFHVRGKNRQFKPKLKEDDKKKCPPGRRMR